MPLKIALSVLFFGLIFGGFKFLYQPKTTDVYLGSAQQFLSPEMTPISIKPDTAGLALFLIKF